jgi:hypothetical protein
VSGAVCCLAFLLGRWIFGLARCDSPERISLIIATGMNNSSAVAVLAAAWFSYRPEVLLPESCPTACAGGLPRGGRLPGVQTPRIPTELHSSHRERGPQTVRRCPQEDKRDCYQIGREDRRKDEARDLH